jgi:S-formylglutathione hydrolase FrmB
VDHSGVLDWSLLRGPLPVAVVAAAAVAATVLLRPRGPRTRWWGRRVPVAVAAAGGTVALLLAATPVVSSEGLPWQVWAYLAATAVAVALAVVAVRAGAGAPRPVAAALVVAVAAASGVNVYYGEFPTPRSALGIAYPDQADLAAVPARSQRLITANAGPLDRVWSPPAGMPPAGQVSEVTIPGPVSGFAARSAWVYLPPAYLAGVRAQLPVLVLLPGQPGDPRDWLDGGRLADRMDRYAAAHRGLAPVVVLADDLGSELGNPLCLDSQLGNAATYLAVDVPSWIRRTLQVDPDPARWAIGGLSHGGTCSLQMALTSPQVYPTFLDISGQDEPSLGTRDETVRAAFGTGPAAAAAFHAVNPLDLLGTRRYLETAGQLYAGADDAEFLPQALRVDSALRGAGVPAPLTVLPGAHTWNVWGPALEAALPWLGTRLGLTG